MCGIAGIIDYNDNVHASESLLRKMNDIQRHRGPDGEGMFIRRHVGLAHRRLAILDLDHGAQPMQSRETGCVLNYNGEIYNYRSLQKKLTKRGHNFFTDCDTEVVLRAFEEWGIDCLSRFNGDFAFACWDGEQLFLARDRLGVKPLHYAMVGSTFVFASEAKAVLSHPAVDRRVDRHALIESMAYFQPMPPRTLFEQVRVLEAGCYLHVDRSGVHHHRYWDLNRRPHTDTPRQTRARVAELLEDAVRLRLQSDVPICGLLSGGLDSSVICTLMNEEEAGALHAFTAGFTGRRSESEEEASHISGDDRVYAARVAEDIGAEHHDVLLDGQAHTDSISAVSYARDLPTVLGSEAGIYKLCNEVSKTATVALSGEGADEVCLGYHMFGHSEPDPFYAVPLPKMAWVLSLGFLFRERPLSYLRGRFEKLIDDIPSLHSEQKDRDLYTMHYVHLKYMLPYMLDRADRLSMASGVELRVPFCDHRFVEYYFNIPPEMKLKAGVEKHLLREAFRGRVHRSVIDRKKSIFPNPTGRDELKHLHKRAFSSLSRRNGQAQNIAREVFNPMLLKPLARLSEWGVAPPIASHLMCSLALGLNALAETHDLSY